MIILSNCLTQTADEGCLKVAVSLVKRIKEKDPQTVVIGYDRQSPLCDIYLPLNKLMLSGKLIRLLRQKKEPVVFVPFSAKMRSTALRTLIISLFARKQVLLVQAMYSDMGKLAKLLMRLSNAKMLCLSHCSYTYYKERLGNQAVYLKTGVDTRVFSPCPPEEKAALRQKYGIPADKPVVLHVGHLKKGRNIGQFAKLSEQYHGLLVVSTHRAEQQDEDLRQQLTGQKNLTLIDGFQSNMEEIYRLSDVYLFPVEEKKSCIDAPLSALEAAACGIPVVTTPFREMKMLIGCEGFYEITSFEEKALNDLLQKALQEQKNPRAAVLTYDWHYAVEALEEL